MKRIILDTDIGTDVDDAMALALTVASPELELLGVTTVHADTPLRARIARRLLALAGRDDIPVIPGASLPLRMPLPPNFHWMPRLRGHEGRGILSDEERTPTADLTETADDAAHFIIQMASRYRGELSLVAIGGQTNLGRALQIEPRLADWVRDVTLMGGTVDTTRFTWPPMLETNLNCDPMASRLVLRSGMPITLVPMEVTTEVFLTPEQRAELKSWNHPLTNALVAMMEAMLEGFADFSAELGLPADFYQGRTFMHDPLAVYASMATELTGVRRTHIEYEEIDQVVRTMGYPDRAPNMWLCEQVDATAFPRFWIERVRRLTSGRQKQMESLKMMG